MFIVHLYAYGAGYRARAHYHPGSADSRCDEDCQYGAPERAYERQQETPGQLRSRLALAASLSLMTPEWSHRQFLLDVGEQMTLPIDRA